jgi:protein MpaA
VRTPRELLSILDDWDVAGHSVQRHPIYARAFAGPKPAVLYFGAIHGDEPLGAHCLVALADELRTRPAEREAWLVAVANPDGFARGVKCNARGVDLNRNYPAKNWSAEHREGYFPGAAPASEPETEVLMSLIELSAATRLISLHSPYRTVNYDGPAQALAERMAAKNGYGASADIGYPCPGSFGSYYGIDKGLEVITLEIPPMTVERAWAENREALLEALI